MLSAVATFTYRVLLPTGLRGGSSGGPVIALGSVNRGSFPVPTFLRQSSYAGRTRAIGSKRFSIHHLSRRGGPRTKVPATGGCLYIGRGCSGAGIYVGIRPCYRLRGAVVSGGEPPVVKRVDATFTPPRYLVAAG